MLLFVLSLARAADVVDTARTALHAVGAQVAAEDVLTVAPLAGGGTLVRVEPAIDGVPVDVSRRVWIDAAGRSHTYAAALPPHVSAVPISAERALAVARDRFGPLPDAHARLSWRPSGRTLRLVWTVDAGRPLPGYTAPLVRLDAATGVLLAIDEGAVEALANAYLENPVVEPQPTEVVLADAAKALTDARLTLQQCRDVGELTPYWFENDDVFVELDVHVCTRLPADGPVAGDYLYEPVPYPAEPARDEDDFAAPHTYFNVHRGLGFFDGLGWTVPAEFDPFLYVTVNYRTANLWTATTAMDPSEPLVPYNNAYSTGGYFDWEDVWVPPQLVFGQGDDADFAYDADVIHHELTHYVVKTQAGPSWSPDGPQGPSVEANALNEGLADYFSCALQGDPKLAEYAGGDELIRDLSGDETCMDDLYGEPHYDSLPFSQALWAYRDSLASKDRTTFDQAVLDGLAIMGPNATFASAADVLIDLAEERLAGGVTLAAELDARGVRDCRARVPAVPGDELRLFTRVPGSYEYANDGPVPGYVQFVVDIPEGGATVAVSFDQSEYLGLDQYGTNEPQPIGVVGRSGDGIEWTTELVKQEMEIEGKVFIFLVERWASNASEVAQSVETGVEPAKTNPRYDLHHATVRWDVAEPGPYTFQFTNAHERLATLTYLSLALTALPLPEDTVDTGNGPLTDVVYESETDEGGCACGTSRAPVAFGWIAVLAIVRRRR